MLRTRFRLTLVLLVLCLGLAASALPVQAASVPGVSGLNVTTANESLNSPVAIVAYQWHASNQNGRSYRQCVNFRVLSRQAVTAVKFTVFFNDQFGNTHSSWVTERNGFFGSGTVSRNVCFDVPTNRIDTSFSNISRLILATTFVRFADGTVWNRGDHFDQAFAPNGNRFTGTTAARAPLNVAQNWADLGRSPVEVISSSTGYDFAGTRPRQCVSFLNVSGKVATDVDFSFLYADASNVPLVTQTHDISGTFTPPVEIDDKCAYVNLGSNDAARRIAHVDVHVTRVVFEDGSQWNSGQGFMRAYGNNGARLASMVEVSPSTPFSAPNVTAGAGGTAVYQPYAPNGGPGYVPEGQPYAPAGQPYVPAGQPYVPPGGYNSAPQYAPAQTMQLPYALVGATISNGNAVDRIVPIYAPIGAGFTLQQPVLGQAVGGTGGSQTVYQPAGYVLTGLDVYRGVYGGVDEVLGMKLYWNRLTASGIDPNDGVTSTVMTSVYPQTYPMKVLRASPGTYISNLIVTPSTHNDGRTFVHDINIVTTPI